MGTSPNKQPGNGKNTLNVAADFGSESNRQRVLAQTLVRPTVRAGATVQMYGRSFVEADLTPLVEELSAQVAAVHGGDLKRAEAMLLSQAHTLEAIFHELARRAALNMGEYINAAEIYMRLALKAQGQCRATIEALAELKNPRPVAFVKQANIAGTQQVNNCAPPEASRARKTENPPNKLLEQQHEQWLDTRAPSATSTIDSQLEPVEAVNGTANTGR